MVLYFHTGLLHLQGVAVCNAVRSYSQSIKSPVVLPLPPTLMQSWYIGLIKGDDFFPCACSSLEVHGINLPGVSLSRESWATRNQSSWLKPLAKMKVVIESSIIYCDGNEQDTKLRRVPTAPSSIFPQGLTCWLRVRWISADEGVISVFSWLREP